MRKIYLLLLLLVTGVIANAQTVANYSFETATGTYTPLVDGGTNVTTLTAVRADTYISGYLNIGFRFNYAGATYTQFKMSSDGYISFGAYGSSQLTNDLSSSSNPTGRPLIAPLWDDLDGGDITSSRAMYTTSNTNATDSVLTVEWQNWQWNYQATTNPVISFQVKLYQADGKIEFSYRQDAGTVSNGSASIGIGAATGSGSGSYLNVTAVPATNSSISSTSAVTNINTKPVTGTIYRFSPPPPCVTPVSQPTALNFTPSSSSISGTFTFASPAVDRYLVVRTQGAALNANPVDATNYIAGDALGNGTVVSASASNSFTSTGLNAGGTNYTYTIFGFNSSCTGGPLYNVSSPLTGSATTTGAYSIASGNWSDGTTWNTGVPPLATDGIFIKAGHTVSVNNAANVAENLTIENGGALQIGVGGALTIGAVNGDNKNLTVSTGASLSVSDGNLNINGNLFVARGANFSQSGGTISVDGNGTNSVAAGIPLVGFGTSVESYNAGTLSLTGGTLIIVDPHTATTNTQGYALYGYFAGIHQNASTSHTLQFGDGVSTASGGHASGFYYALVVGGNRLALGNVVVNNPSGTNRNVTQVGTTVINGNMSITAGAYSQNSNTLYVTGNILMNGGEYTQTASYTTYVGGDININDATFNALGTTYFATSSNAASATQTVPQSVSVSGTGVIRNSTTTPTANFTSVNINNTSATGVTFNDLNDITNNPANAASISGTLTFTAGYASAPSGTIIVLGVPTPAVGTLSYTAGGILPGTAFGRWYANTTTGTSLTSVAARYPFVDATGKNRSAYLAKTSATGSLGLYVANYTDGTGLSTVNIADPATPAYTIDRQYNGYWSFSTPLSTPTGASYTMALYAQDAYAASNTNSRVTLASAPAVGTHTAGGSNPVYAQRTGTAITQALLTASPYYIGINNSDIAAAPDCATLSAPADAATNVASPVSLSWAAAAGATSYDVFIGSSVGTATNVANVTGTTYSYTAGVASSTYYWYIVPKNASGSATGCDASARSFTIISIPDNDDCINATALTVNNDYACASKVTGRTTEATASVEAAYTCGVANSGGANDDVWYKFVATSAAHRITLTNTTGTTDMQMVVYSGACGGLTQVTGGCSDPDILNLTGLNIGETYFVRVFTYTATATSRSTSFDICVGTPPPPPVNDNVAGAIALADGVVVNGNNNFASASSPTITGGCTTGTQDDDMWYKFTTTGGSVTITQIGGGNSTTGYDGVLQLMDATMTQIGTCKDAGAYAGTETITETLVAGEYFIRVWEYYANGATNSTNTFTIKVDGASVVLPVTLSSFTGVRVNGVNKLSWTTKTEVNNAGFELQRSADGKNFTKLGYVAAKSENGNSTRELNYSFNDTKPYAGISYYRLNQIDKDGKSTLSNVVAIKGDKLNEVQFSAVYPNPAKDRLNVVLASPKAERVTLVVTDLSGKVIKQQIHNAIEGNNNIEVNVNSLSAGTYIIKLVCASGCETAIQKFMKN